MTALAWIAIGVTLWAACLAVILAFFHGAHRGHDDQQDDAVTDLEHRFRYGSRPREHA